MRAAEFVTPKHPDKMCDQISDAVLDWALGLDPNARVAIEVMGGHGKVYVVGELTMKESVGGSHLLPTAVKSAVTRITGDPNLDVTINVVQQSPEIAGGVDTGGAGDQGIMRGYATSETESLMPLEYELARDLCRYLYNLFPYDGKTQVTINEDGIQTIVASFQNVPKGSLEYSVSLWLKGRPCGRILANPAGDWSVGGFDADTGLTGRKLLIDNYGPRYPIGGGAFSGKDGTKVDRSAAYLARKVAVNLLQVRKVKEVSVELAYAIGVAQPVSVVATADGLKVDLTDVLGSTVSVTPRGIIDLLRLKEPQFEETARWGHFGNDFIWDK